MASFAADTAIRRDGDRLTATLSPRWEIWGPNGGYLSAIALRAAGVVAPPGHRPVSISVQYLARAAFADVDIAVTPLRQGGNAWCLDVALAQDDKRFLAAQVWTTAKDDGPALADHAMPPVPAPDACRSPAEVGVPPHPFWRNFDQRFVPGHIWGEPAADGPRLRQWIRYRDAAPVDDAFLAGGRALLLIDTLLWPAHARHAAGALGGDLDYIAPSLDLTAWFHEPNAQADWLLAEIHAGHAARGLIHGDARVWSEDGRLIASGGGNMLHMVARRPS